MEILAVIIAFFTSFFTTTSPQYNTATPSAQVAQKSTFPLSIDAMRARKYPGTELKIEQTLEDGGNYHRYVASYQSDGLKIYGLLTIPIGEKPQTGWPVVIFNHGYIPPEVYRTTERYIAYTDAFSRNGYILFRPDYRGNGFSEGQPEGAYYSPAYTVDVLNALASVKRLREADPNRIGMWGHSLGGNITMRSLVISKEVKVAVIWGAVVGTYDDLMNRWRRAVPFQPSERQLALRNNRRTDIIKQYGAPESNPTFWHSIDPNYFLQDVTAPVQIHHAKGDEEVPVEFSEQFADRLKAAGKTVELYTYEGDNHNINGNFNTAMQRSVTFMDQYLK